MILLALLFALSARRLFTLAMFGLGALLFGYGGYVAVIILAPFVPGEYSTLVASDPVAYTVAGLAGIAGGYALATCGKSFINMALGVLGAVLVAQGTVTILLADLLSPETIDYMRLGDKAYTP